MNNIIHLKPCFGDHELIVMDSCIVKPKNKTVKKWDWRRYSKDSLCNGLGRVDWSNNATTVQESWNDFETKLIKIVDSIVPITDFDGDKVADKPCPVIKRKFNIRKRLLKKLKRDPTVELKSRIKNLNAEIRSHFHSLKKKAIRQKIIPGNSKSLWNAVNMSKDIVSNCMPFHMTIANKPVDEHV